MEKTELAELRTQTSTMMDRAKELARAVCDSATESAAASFLLESKRWVANVIERLKGPKQNAHRSWRDWCDLESELIEPHQRIEREIIKPALVAYQQKQEEARRIKEAQMRAEAQKREEDARLAEAELLEAQGDHEQAERTITEPVVTAPVILPGAPTPDGISYREAWKFEIADPMAIPREYLLIDESKIGAVVRALKNLTNIPGIRVYSTKEVAGRIR